VTADFALGTGPLAATEKKKALSGPSRLNGKIQKLLRRRRIGDLYVWAGSSLDKPVSKGFHPAMPVTADKPLECWSSETRRADRTPDTDVHKHRRLEPPVLLYRIDSIDKLAGMLAPPIVAPCEDGHHEILSVPF
jgi:hypothetical protein